MALGTARHTGASSCTWLSRLCASPPSSAVTTVVAEGWPLWEYLYLGDSKYKSGFFFFFLESLELSLKKSTNTSLAVLNTARILFSHSFCGTGNEGLIWMVWDLLCILQSDDGWSWARREQLVAAWKSPASHSHAVPSCWGVRASSEHCGFGAIRVLTGWVMAPGRVFGSQGRTRLLFMTSP